MDKQNKTISFLLKYSKEYGSILFKIFIIYNKISKIIFILGLIKYKHLKSKRTELRD